MPNPAGVYTTKRKDGSTYYRVSITIGGRHISLGSYDDISTAGAVYTEAGQIMNSGYGIDDYAMHNFNIPFRKYVVLINYRDNKIYFKTPVYLSKNYFTYYIIRVSFSFSISGLFYHFLLLFSILTAHFTFFPSLLVIIFSCFIWKKRLSYSIMI